MLEELARDVTGWPAHAVEFFELLGWTQWVRNHLRLHSLRTPDIRSVERMDRLDGAFDEIAHTVDVRPISQDEGWHNVPQYRLLLWRLGAYRAGAGCRRAGSVRPATSAIIFSPLGNSAPLFSRAAAKATRRGSRPSCTCRSRSGLRGSSPGIGDFYGLFDPLPPLPAPKPRASWCSSTASPVPADARRVPQSVGLVAAADRQDRHRRGARPPDAWPGA